MDLNKAESWLDDTEWECSTNVNTDSIKKAMSYLNFIGQINVTSYLDSILTSRGF